MSEETDAQLLPFHKSIVMILGTARDVATAESYGTLIKRTKIPQGHDEILNAWNGICLSLGYYDDGSVVNSLQEQKKRQARLAAAPHPIDDEDSRFLGHVGHAAHLSDLDDFNGRTDEPPSSPLP